MGEENLAAILLEREGDCPPLKMAAMFVIGEPDLDASSIGECAREWEGVPGRECAGVTTLLDWEGEWVEEWILPGVRFKEGEWLAILRED